MGKIEINYGNVENVIARLKSVVSYLEDENRDIKDALRELYDLENYYYDKGEIVRELEYRQKNVWKDIRDTEDLIGNLDSFKNEVKEVDEKLANRFKQNIEQYAKANNIETTSDFESFLNFVQGGLDLLGFVPIIGDVVDGVNAVIYLMRGDYTNALISSIAVIPFIGDAAKGVKYVDKASDLLKLGDKAVDIGKSTAKVAGKNAGKAVKKYALDIAAKGEKAFSKVLDASIYLGKGDYIGYIKGKGEAFFSKVNDKLPDSIALCLQGGCLLGDTLVRTESGLKNIRDVEKGELVLSKDNEKGIKEYKRVLEVHRNSAKEICIIKTRNGKIEKKRQVTYL